MREILLAGLTAGILLSRPGGTTFRRRSNYRRRKPKEITMTITCFIRYEIDPFGKAAFEQYAKAWGQAIPRCGADLIGYYAPHEGSATTAYAAYNIDSLAAYEAYRARLAADPAGKANYEFARREKFILKEDRIFLKLVSGPHGPQQLFQTAVKEEA
jgi:hypothetical protein